VKHIPSQVDGKPLTVGPFTVPAGQKELILQSIDPATTRAWEANNGWTWLELVAWFVALAVVAGFGVSILSKFARGTIDVKDIISEANGKASLSRFQALLFTFVFVISLALIVVRTGRFPTDVPLGVWALLAGSLGTYLVSKGMQLGLGDGAAVPAGFQTGGPVLRYGDNIENIVTGMTAEEANKKRQATSGEARFLVPAGTNAFGQPYVVASTVGKLKLTIRRSAHSQCRCKGKDQIPIRCRNRSRDGIRR